MDEVRAVMEWRALNYYPAESKVPPADHYRSRFCKEPEPPNHCAYSEYLIDIMFSLISQRQRDDLDVPFPLSATLIKDHCAVMGLDLSPQDCEVLIECDNHYRNAVTKRMILHRSWLSRQAQKK